MLRISRSAVLTLVSAAALSAGCDANRSDVTAPPRLAPGLAHHDVVVDPSAPRWFSGNNHYYQAVESFTDYATANARAASRSYFGCTSAHLVTITSAAEDAFVAGLAPAGGAYWTGGVQSPQPVGGSTAAGWTWTTGEAFSYAAWRPDEPNDGDHFEDGAENNLYVNTGTGFIVDYPFWKSDIGYIVEFEGCPPPPAVDPISGHGYVVVDVPSSYASAKAGAAARGSWQGCPAHLATINSAEEDAFVAGLRGPNAYIIGLEQHVPPGGGVGDGWIWVTGEPFTFVRWRPGEPADGGDFFENGQEDVAFIQTGGGDNGGSFADWPAGLVEIGYIVEFDCGGAGNQAPSTPTISGATTVSEGSAVSLTASSSDPDGDALTYSWKLDGSPAASGASFTHTFADNGSHSVSVSVDDGHGHTVSATTGVTVTNVSPSVGALPSATIYVGETYSASTSFSDPGADTWTTTLSYGDDSGPSSATGTPGASINVTHTYTQVGVFHVTVSVTDKDGGAGQASATITVLSAASAASQFSASLLNYPGVDPSDGAQLKQLMDQVAAKLASGNNVAADNQLTAFENKVNALKNSGRISGATAQSLLDAAERIRRAIGPAKKNT